MRTHNPEEAQRSIVSEFLPGIEWTVDVYVREDGVPVYIVPRERLGLAGGISIKGRTVKNFEVIKRTEMLLKKLPVRGPACIQWKADKNGTPKLVEVNPRLAGGTLITVASGANPIRAILDEVRGKTTPSVDWQEVTVVGWLDYKTL
jgi:carbamoyl-phosphate synthase large subunit